MAYTVGQHPTTKGEVVAKTTVRRKILADRESTAAERAAFDRIEEDAIMQAAMEAAGATDFNHMPVGAGEGCHERAARPPERQHPDPSTLATIGVAAHITRYCRKCGETKVLDDFKYRLPGGEARKRGYNGYRKVVAEGNICRACRPKRKPLGQLTAKEMHNRVVNDNLPPMIAEAKLARKKQKAEFQQVKGQVKRWLNDLTRMWSPIIESINREQHRVAQSVKFLRHPRGVKTPLTGPALVARLDFYKEYHAQMKALKARIRMYYILNDRHKFWPLNPQGAPCRVLTEREFEEAPPKMGVDLAHWTCYLFADDWNALYGMWEHTFKLSPSLSVRIPPLRQRTMGMAPEEQHTR
jgi:hypothetical protein